MPIKKTDLKAEAGVKLTLVEEITPQGVVRSQHYRLTTLRPTQPRVLASWTSERLVRSQTGIGQPSFLYLFNHGYPAADQAGLHAFHASELPFMFGTLDRTPPRWPKIPTTPDEEGFSRAMIEYWTSFARDGRPEAPEAAPWPPYSSDGSYMAFRDDPSAQAALTPGMFTLHETAMCRRRASGDLAWNWNTGLASPTLTLPSKNPTCP